MVGGLCPYRWIHGPQIPGYSPLICKGLLGWNILFATGGAGPLLPIYMDIYVYIYISNVVGYVCATFLVPIYPFFGARNFLLLVQSIQTCRRRWAWTLLTVAWHVFERIYINHFLRVQVFVVLVFRHVSRSWRVSCSWHASSWFYSSSSCCCSCSCSCSCSWSRCCSRSCSCSSYSLCLICVFKVSLDCSILSMMDECFAGHGLGAVLWVSKIPSIFVLGFLIPSLKTNRASWKINHFERRYIFKWLFLGCHVSLWGCICLFFFG